MYRADFFKLFKRNKALFILISWLAIVPILTSASITVLLIEHAHRVYDFGILEWGLFFGCSVFSMAMAITPTTYLCMVSGYFLGMESIVYLAISYQFACTMGYFLAKFLDRDLFEELISNFKGGWSVRDGVRRKDLILTILCRLSPGLPFALMNVALSIANVRFSRFFWGGLIGMLPRTLFFIWVGSQAAQLRHVFEQKEDAVWVIGLTLVVFGAIYFVLRPSRQNIH